MRLHHVLNIKQLVSEEAKISATSAKPTLSPAHFQTKCSPPKRSFSLTSFSCYPNHHIQILGVIPHPPPSVIFCNTSGIFPPSFSDFSNPYYLTPGKLQLFCFLFCWLQPLYTFNPFCDYLTIFQLNPSSGCSLNPVM